LEYEKVNKDSILAVTKEDFSEEDLKPSEAEIQLREEVLAEENKINLEKKKK
jgi:hypothetical protein